MATKNQKKYKGVYCDKNGKIFYQADLGIDPVTGKRVQKKARKNQYGKPFSTMKEAYDESYMNSIYLRAYKQKVQAVTYKTALPHHKLFIQYFGSKLLKGITARDCESFRLHIIEHYSENYAKNLWSRFKACMGYAERLGYISSMPCKALVTLEASTLILHFGLMLSFRTLLNHLIYKITKSYRDLQLFGYII